MRGVLVVFASLMVACAPTLTPAPSTQTPIPPEPTLLPGGLRLRVGESDSIAGGIEVTFIGVSDDSRCPRDVECIWAGTATVVLRFDTGNEIVGPLDLVLGGQPPTDIEIDGVVLEVVDLKPYPLSTQQIDPREYIVTLAVSTR